MSAHRFRRTLRFRPALVALSLLATLSACTTRQDKRPDTRPSQDLAPAQATDPMASFARLLPGEWQVTAQSGTSLFHTWHWGPGRHSMRRRTDGSDAGGSPWRELRVVYWHPGRLQVVLLGLTPFREGVMEGTIQFEGESADSTFDLYQAGDLRKMRLRWTFDGADRYREALLEAIGPAGFTALAEWEHVRSPGRAATLPRAIEEAPGPSSHLRVLEPLLGHTWEAQRVGATGDASPIRTSFEWIPQIDAVYVRVLAPARDGEATHLLDAYLYHHTGTGALRCLALSSRGGVYEGDLTVLDGGAWELELTGYEGDRVIPHTVRFDFEPDGTLRQRDWTLAGGERTLRFDLHHKKVGPKKG